MSADRRGINVLLAALDLEQQVLAQRMGYESRYVSNVVNGFTEPSDAFKQTFGAVVADLLLGESRTTRSRRKRLPAAPLASFLEQRAKSADNRKQFFAELGLNPHGWNKRQYVTESLVDRICCALGVHPSSLYGSEFDVEQAS